MNMKLRLKVPHPEGQPAAMREAFAAGMDFLANHAAAGLHVGAARGHATLTPSGRKFLTWGTLNGILVQQVEPFI